MNTLTKLTFLAATLFAAAGANAEMVKGHLRSNGTYVAPYYRTPANGTVFDNLSYHGYPSQEPGYVFPNFSASGSSFGSRHSHQQMADSDFGFTTRFPSSGTFNDSGQTLPYQSPWSHRSDFSE